MLGSGNRLGRKDISRLRWVVRLVGFVVIMYGGFVTFSGRPPVEPSSGPTSIKQVRHRPVVAELHLPATSCIYQRNGLCRGCSLYMLTETAVWHQSIEWVLWQLAVLLPLMLLGARLWCGWICPLGTLSDVLTFLRRATGLSRVRLGRRTRDGLVWFKYVLLGLVMATAVLAGLDAFAEQRLSLSEPFCRICPSRIFAAFFTLDQPCWTNWRDSITSVFTWLGLLAFALFFLGLTIRRFWCRICPIGGLTAPFNRTGLVMLDKDPGRCSFCGACERVCPLDVRKVHLQSTRGAATAYECHLCLRCVEACPEPDCLKFRWLGKVLARSGKKPS